MHSKLTRSSCQCFGSTARTINIQNFQSIHERESVSTLPWQQLFLWISMAQITCDLHALKLYHTANPASAASKTGWIDLASQVQIHIFHIILFFPFLILIDVRLAYAKPCAKASAACRVASAKAFFEKRFRKASASWLFCGLLLLLQQFWFNIFYCKEFVSLLFTSFSTWRYQKNI